MFFTLAIHVLKIDFWMKCVTLETHLSHLMINHDNFFKNHVFQAI